MDDDRLYLLVAELLKPGELMTLVENELPMGRKLAMDLPDPLGAARRQYAGEVVAALERRKRVDKHFFHALTRHVVPADAGGLLDDLPNLKATVERINAFARASDAGDILPESGQQATIVDLKARIKKQL